jgi:hypothetical protein
MYIELEKKVFGLVFDKNVHRKTFEKMSFNNLHRLIGLHFQAHVQ